MPKEAFQPLFTYRQEFAGTFHGRHFVNNEFNHVFLVTFTAPLPREAFRLQEEEVADVKFVAFPELKRLLEAGDPDHITYLAGLEKKKKVRSGPSTRVLTRVGGREEVMHGRSTRPTDTADPAPGAGAATTRPPRRTAAPARGVPVGKPARAGDTVLILVVRRRRGREGARGEALTDGPCFFSSPPRAAVPGLLRHPRGAEGAAGPGQAAARGAAEGRRRTDGGGGRGRRGAAVPRGGGPDLDVRRRAGGRRAALRDGAARLRRRRRAGGRGGGGGGGRRGRDETDAGRLVSSVVAALRCGGAFDLIA